MIIGNGMIANAFSNSYKDNSDIVIFASGVSNSKTNDINEFNRELNLLIETKKTLGLKKYKLIYFSTCSILDPSLSESRYVQHKVNIEKYIISNFDNYLIVRLSNVVGLTKNNNTIFNYLAHSILEGKHFYLWKNSERNLIDIDDAFLIVNNLIKNVDKRVINVANTHNQNVYNLAVLMEKYFHKSANYSVVDVGTTYKIPLDDIIKFIIKENNINFSDDYSSILLKKYFPLK